jgi:hypothetical protein
MLAPSASALGLTIQIGDMHEQARALNGLAAATLPPARRQARHRWHAPSRSTPTWRPGGQIRSTPPHRRCWDGHPAVDPRGPGHEPAVLPVDLPVKLPDQRAPLLCAA